MKAKRAKGWVIPARLKMRLCKSFVNVDAVCSCRHHKRCERDGQRCDWTLTNSEGHAADMLRREMGKKFPKDWGRRNLMWWNAKQYNLMWKALRAFQQKRFKQCRPVTVEVRAR